MLNNSMVGGEGEPSGRFDNTGKSAEVISRENDSLTTNDILHRKYIRNCLTTLLYELDPTASTKKLDKMNFYDLIREAVDWLESEISIDRFEGEK